MPEELRIVGIDPGSIRCGYGVIACREGQYAVVEYGVIEAGRRTRALPQRLRFIFDRLRSVLERTCPHEAAVESTFYARNAQSLAKLAQARGVALVALALSDIPVVEYSPRTVKQAVTGRGDATKEQVHYMVRTILRLDAAPRVYDVSDALAVALCHAFRRITPMEYQRPRTWREFVQCVPERVLSPTSLPDTE
jgi:crossover junction endodeoxyribonuclease RuvC